MGIFSGPTLDLLFGVSPLCVPDLASPRRLQVGVVIGRRLGHLLPREDASGSLDLCCGCPSPYQCEGTNGPSHLPGGLPSPLRRSTLLPLAEGQFDVYGIHPTRRWHSVSPPSSGTPDPPPSPAQCSNTSGRNFRRRWIGLSRLTSFAE